MSMMSTIDESIPNDEWKWVTPEVAAEFLTQGFKGDRALNQGRVEEYAHYMLRNEWDPHVDPGVHFLSNGTRVNGRHRFAAIVLAKEIDPQFQGILLRFVYDVPLNSTSFLDTGGVRTRSQRIQWEGVPYAHTIAPIMRWGRAWNAGFKTPGAYMATKAGEAADKIAEREYLLNNQDALIECARYGVSLYNNSRGKKSSPSPKTATATEFAVTSWMLNHIDSERADTFLRTLATGELASGVVNDLRNKLISLRSLNRTKPRSDEVIARIFMGWNFINANRSYYDRLPFDTVSRSNKLTEKNFPLPSEWKPGQLIGNLFLGSVPE